MSEEKKQSEMCWIVTDDPIVFYLPDGYTMEKGKDWHASDYTAFSP